MKISIIVPVHNNANSIGRCVASLVNQKNADKEILLIENNSTDTSKQICNNLSKNCKDVVFYEINSQGVSNARNFGLNKANGDIIGFCDADDFYEDNVLKMILEQFNVYNLDMLVTGFQIIDASNETIMRHINRDVFISPEILMKMIINDERIMGSVWNKFYRCELLKNIRFDEELDYCEDTYFNVNILQNHGNAKCKVISKTTYNYCANDGSTTHDAKKIYDSNNRLKYINMLNKILMDFNLSDEIKCEIGYAIFWFASQYGYLLLKEKEMSSDYTDKLKILKNEAMKHIHDFFEIFRQYSKSKNIKAILKFCLLYIFEKIY